MPALGGGFPVQAGSRHLWKLVGPRAQRRTIAYRPRLICEDLFAVKEAALAGCGIADLPTQSPSSAAVYDPEPVVDGLGLWCSPGVGLDDFIHSGIELCNCQRLLEIGQRRWILAHRSIVFDTAPLRVHRDLCSIEPPMQAA
jgi:DNA-binding transcriptional LysR family regulator